MAKKSKSVVLLGMPFTGRLYSPSLSLAQLKAINEASGISTRVIETELDLSHQIGRELFADLEWPTTDVLFFDAIFSTFIFDENPLQAEVFFDRYRDTPLTNHGKRLVAKHSFLAKASTRKELLVILFNFLRSELNVLLDRVAHEVVSLNPHVVGASTTFEQTLSSVAVFKRIKRIAPQIVTVLGGFNCEGYAGKALVKNFCDIDIAFSGESEFEFRDCCQHIVERGLESYLDMAAQKSWNKRTAFLDKKDIGPIRVTTDTLESHPAPDFKDYIFQLLTRDARGLSMVSLPFMGSRGCWWGEKMHCTFCGLNDELLVSKSKSPEQLYSEILGQHKRYGITNFFATDLILSKHFYNTFVAKLGEEHPGKFRIYYQLKANMTYQNIVALKKAGISHVQPGIENFDDDELKRMSKGVTGIQNIAFLKYCLIEGVDVNWNILYNRHTTPNHKLAEMKDLLPLLFHFDPPKAIRVMGYPRYSVYYEKRKEYGLDLRPNGSYRDVYRFDDDEINDFAYFYTDETPITNVLDPALLDEIESLHQKWQARRGAALTFRVISGIEAVVHDSRFESETFFSLVGDGLVDLLELGLEPFSIEGLCKKINDGTLQLKHSCAERFIDRIQSNVQLLVEKKIFFQSKNRIINLAIPEHCREVIP